MIGNQIRTALLLGILTGILLVIGSLIGGKSGLTVAFIFAILMNIGSLFFSHKLVLLMYRAKEAKKEDYAELHNIVEEVAYAAGIPKPKVYIVPSENPNAFATGPTYKRSVVAVTQGILKLLNKDELRGVIAHEVAHIKNRDMLISSIAATIAAVISYVAFMARWGAMFGGGERENQGNNIIGLIALSILAPIAATIIQLAISRSREYIADASGAKLVKNGESLAKALEKLHDDNKKHPLMFGTDATNHLMIVSPFRGAGRAFVNLFSTHPDYRERCKKLRALTF